MRHRRKFIFTALAIAGVMGTASSAFACVPFRGRLQVITNAAGRVDGDEVAGDGSGTSHVYCSGWEPHTAAVAKNGESLTVNVLGSTGVGDPCTSGSNKLNQDGVSGADNKVYMSEYADAEGAPFAFNTVPNPDRWDFNAGTGCFRASPVPSSSKLQADITVDSNGDGTTTFNISNMTGTNGANDAALLCVGNVGLPGIFAPVRMVAV